MISLSSGIIYRRENVLALQIRIVRQNFFDARPSAKQFKDVRYADPHPANARAAAALRVVDRDSTEAILSHGSSLARDRPQARDELIVPACEGALRVLRAARDVGVKRVVLTSSFAAIGRVKQILPELGKMLGWTLRSREDPVVATAESLVRLGLLKGA